jgi:hypothetical protein
VGVGAIVVDEQTEKVIAAFTPVGEWWPVGAWIVNSEGPTFVYWHKIANSTNMTRRIRLPHEISELEANQKGYFRDESEGVNNHWAPIKTSTDNNCS